MEIYSLQKKLKRSEEEKNILNNKNTLQEDKFKRLLNEMNEIKEIFDKTVYDYKCEINRKNEEIYLLKVNYDKMTYEFQKNLDHVFI